MKVLEFETSKGMFIVVERESNTFDVCVWSYKYELIDSLKEITEEQASEIVDEDNEYGVRIFQNYQTTSMQYFDEQITAIESLHSLLKSKGIHLFKNPYVSKINPLEYKEAEKKTFYNPYIFKL